MAGPRRAPNSGSPLPGTADARAGRTPRGTAKDRALRLLGVRARSREELRRRLTAAGFDPQDIERALGDLQAAGLIDDERFARELARDRAGRRLEGDRLVRATLVRQGVAPDLADRVLVAAATAPGARDQDERAAELAARKAARMRGVEPEVAYRRLVSLLLRRGHPPDAAREAARRAIRDLANPCDPSASAVD